MAIGDPITQPIPPVGTAGTGYASQLVAFLTEMKARLEAKVALTSLVAGLFDLTNNGIANAKYVGLYEQLTVPTTPVGSLQRYGGELYYVSPSGAVRITNGGTLDVVSLRGITGDYAAPAEFRYDLPSLEYYAYSNQTAGPKEWARIAAQGYDVYGTLTGTTRVRLAWAGGANPSYTLTLPATVPATVQKLIQMTTAGALLADNTGIDDMALTTDKNITLVGTGRVKADVFSAGYFSFNLYEATAAGSPLSQTGGSAGVTQAASSTAYYKLPVVPGFASLTDLTVQGGTIPATCTMEIVTVSSAGAWSSFSLTQVGTGASSVVWSGLNLAGTQGPQWLKVTTGAAGITLYRGLTKYKLT